MKLDEVKPYLEMSGQLDEQFFSIKDTGMIFDILRNKMYSNPILAICREISCNARDAHREVGTPDKPIEITLPNTLLAEYRIKDYGPGISPDRMTDIFIKYTASTKRDDNVQTGGFGLGSKTPFSYSDTFNICTVHNGIKYLYNCFIDPTKVGKLMLGDQFPTDEPSGTEIIIPVLPKNFNDFKIWTEQACRFWEVKPLIKGGQIDWRKDTPILNGTGWEIITSTNYGYNRSAKIVIDGIEYPLDYTSLKKYADSSLIDAAKGDFVMYFNIGELSLSANREQIHQDEKTQKAIRLRLSEIQKELKQRVIDKINDFPDLWTANVYYKQELRQAFNTIKFLGQLTWKGIALSDYNISTHCPVYTFTRGKYSRKYGTDPNKLSRSRNIDQIQFYENCLLYINDLPIKEPSHKHVKKAFDDNPQLKYLQVVCPADKAELDKLNTSINLDKMEPKLLSAITKASARKYTFSGTRVLIFKLDPAHKSFRQVSHANFEEDTNDKVICRLTKDQYNNSNERSIILNNKKKITYNLIPNLLKHKNISFYGVDSSIPEDKFKEFFDGLVDIEDFIKEKFDKTPIEDFIKIKLAMDHTYNFDHKMLSNFTKISSMITDQNSLFVTRLKLHEELQKLSKSDNSLLHMYEHMHGIIESKKVSEWVKKNKEYDIDALNASYNAKYPLLKHLSYYDYSTIAGDIANYVNLIDKE